MARGRAGRLARAVDGALRALLTACVGAALGAVPAHAAAPAARAPIHLFVPVLTYHHVKWIRPAANAIERGLTISPTQFQSELRYLAENHYHTVSTAQLVSALRGRSRLPFRPVVLTFDDGYVDMYANVYRPLRRARMTATFFIVPGFLGTPRYLSWKEVKAMSADGMDIEAHTMTHPDLRMVPAAQARAEVEQSRSILERQLHRPIGVFAYPYGGFNRRIVEDVARAGYGAAFTTQQGWIQSSGAMLTLPRVYVDNDDTPGIFAGRLRGDPRVLAQDPT